MKKILKAFSSPLLMGSLFIMLIVSMAMATFIENDFGSEVARARVYNAWWFELLLVLTGLNLLLRIFELKLYPIQKLSVFLFHLAFVIMIIGAGVTRYFGYEGTMHIREGESSSVVKTNESALSVKINNGNGNSNKFMFKTDIEQKQRFHSTIETDNNNIDIELTRYYPNAVRQPVELPQGKKIIGFVLIGDSFRGFQYISDGEVKKIGGLSISFDADTTSNIRFRSSGDSLLIASTGLLRVKPMQNTAEVYVANEPVPFENQVVYETAGYNIVFREYYPSATIEATPAMPGDRTVGMKAFVFTLADGQNQSELVLWEDMLNSYAAKTTLGKSNIELMYGAYQIDLPFSLHLDDFRIERYPGSNSPSSFSSFVTVNEEGKEPVPHHIFMNNILKYRGYRFFQSSYDNDEQGTILSVNKDSWGAGITYLSYILLAIGILWSLINPHSFFRKIGQKGKVTAIAALLLTAGMVNATPPDNIASPGYVPVSEKHATRFGSLLVQNAKGRTEPVYTFSSELIRKIARKDKVEGLSPAQLFLEMNIDPGHWTVKPLIRVSNRELQQRLGLTGKYAAYADFFSRDNGYILRELVRTVYAKPAASRSKFDKAVMKTDEKVNICYTLFSGQYLRILPVPGIADSTKWHTPAEAPVLATTRADSAFLANVISNYFDAVKNAKKTNNYRTANVLLDSIAQYQRTNAGYDLHGNFKIKTEIAYVKTNLFKKLFPFYFTLGIVYLFYLLFLIVIGRQTPGWLQKTFYIIVMLAFAVHTLGIAVRWYISGHAPMSNGYESMIFISWVTLLAGFLFSKKSGFTLTATVILAGLTLLVANLSFMDPEITNLVPVLQSYWLTVHVSVITASYGFLGLGFLLGLINLLLVVLRSGKNHARIKETFTNLTVINHRTLILGLYLLTIGTFLGAVWANESWGRYWGWDPKETWALISVLVYTMVTHARMIPGMKGDFTFNVLSVYGFGSILMTYFGVNYYLSGLHSYAGGDPVPIPSFVYFSLAALITLTLISSVKFSKHFSG